MNADPNGGRADEVLEEQHGARLFSGANGTMATVEAGEDQRAPQEHPGAEEHRQGPKVAAQVERTEGRAEGGGDARARGGR